MANQLESALVIALRDTIKWESAVSAPASGTLTPVNASLPFDAKTYQQRDRQLAYRDLIVGAAVVEVSVQVSDVWNYSVLKPKLQGPVEFSLPLVEAEAGTFSSQVRHVTNVSIPYDAARYADADLYGRDALVYEVLARACSSTFVDPSIPQIDVAGTAITDTSIWSLAEGEASRSDINAGLPLNRDLFKKPDANLADRDNQLAGYVAQLAQVLKNPFEHALRLYVQIEAYGTVEREPDVYALASDDGTHRIFQTEPALPGGNQIIYDGQQQTLQWIREHVDEVHVPQIYAMVIPGIEMGQTVTTLAQAPDGRDAQYWRGKANQFNPEGIRIASTDLFLTATNNDSVVGGVPQYGGASLTVADQMTFNMSGSLPAGNYRVSVLAKPSRRVEIAGAQNISDTSGTLGGVTFEVDVPSGSIVGKAYAVKGGDGIVYNGVVYLPGETFVGTSSVSTYTQYGLLDSSVRQYLVTFTLALPAGAWTAWMEYTNLTGVTDGFGIKAEYVASGAEPVTVMQDIALIPFSGTNGNLVLTPVAGMDVANEGPFTFPVYWTKGEGQLHIRKLVFESEVTSGRYAMTGTFLGSTAQVDVIGEDQVPGVLRWHYASASAVTGTIPFTINYTADSTLPIQLEQVQVQALTDFETTSLSRGFQGWRQECLARAERAVVQGYHMAVQAYGSEVPSFRDAGSYWSGTATEDWMSFAEVYVPRLREISAVGTDCIVPGCQYAVDTASATYDGTAYTEGQTFYGVESAGTIYSGGTVHQVGAFVKSKAGHVGQPALVPYGLYFDDTTKQVKAFYDTSYSTPTIMACQPWMIEQGIYVIQEEFQMPETVGLSLITTQPFALSLTASPSNGGTVYGGGYYPPNSVVSALAVVSPLSLVLDVGVDMAFAIDESGSMGGVRKMLTEFLPNFDALLQSKGIGSGTVPNRYSLVGFSASAGGYHDPTAGLSHTHSAFTDITTLMSVVPQMVTGGGGGLGEDAYDGISHAINNLSWRTSSAVARVLMFCTDEDRNYHYYTTGGPTQDEQFAAIAAEITGLNVLLLAMSASQLKDSLGNRIIGFMADYTTYREDGVGGYTQGVGGYAFGPGGGGDSGLYGSGMVQEYAQLGTYVGGQVWDYEKFNHGIGLCNTYDTVVYQVAIPSSSWAGLAGTTIDINGTVYTIDTTTSTGTLTLTTSAGSQSSVEWIVPSTTRDSSIAALTDALDTVIGETLSWTFDGWYENSVLVSSSGSYGFTLTGNRNLEARFSIPDMPPVADFTGSPRLGGQPLSVAFSNLSTNGTSFLWSFGDSTSSTAENPTHDYSTGTYTVSLTAINAAGTDTLTRSDYIEATASAVTSLPPTEGLDYFWEFAPPSVTTVYQTLSNPNDVAMTVTWVEFPGANFYGPFTTPVVIPAHSSYNFGVTCGGALGTSSTTGAWSTSGGSGALTGEADCT